MKKILDAFPAVLLLAFFIYLGINPISIGPIVGFVASSLLFAYQQYLFRTEQPDLRVELEAIQSEFLSKLETQKKETQKEFTDLKTDLAKFSLSMSRIPGVSEKPKEKQRVQF